MTQHFSLSSETTTTARIDTMQDVADWVVAQAPNPEEPRKDNPVGYLLQALRTLVSHCAGAPLSTMPADPAWIEEHFPKVVKGVHPRPELGQSVGVYQKWRADLLRSIKKANGAEAEVKALRARKDGWADLIAAVQLHTTTHGGSIHPAALSPLTKLADIARRAGVEPRDLDQPDVLSRLEQGFRLPLDRQDARNGQDFLNKHAYIPELAAELPQAPVVTFPILRAYAPIPEHIDAFLVGMVETAAKREDKVMKKDSQGVVDTTKSGWLSALRHHVRTLPDCPAEPDLDYPRPITNLDGVNDAAALFEADHLYASIRRTAAVEHLPGTIIHVSAYDYYSAIMVVLSRNGLIDAETCWGIKDSEFMVDGKALAHGMTAANQAWCENLVQNPLARRRFRNLHRIMQAKANDLLPPEALAMPRSDAKQRAAYREFVTSQLTGTQFARLRQLGVCAAACAIEYAGRPIRKANCLGLRIHGSTRNFFTPTKHRPYYGFTLGAHETKAGKQETLTKLHDKLHGPQVLRWYLDVIRPLFEHAEASIYLFPGVTKPGQSLNHKTFDTWFQRAASDADMTMTFHLWRHGYASLLLAQDWGNLAHAAAMLGNTPAVCGRNYAWIDEQRLFLDGQQKMIASAEADQ
ncbi:site-specific integrase [Limimaricola litoreus]|uniref:Phage integrase family protein n=1 Tax=Limimaricola litoreus TaxID=2955316 RepID=A0A9X2FNY0_9RHOB|nr:hypothetical protein [Limimaricola litoreus]MCP1168907.1 hypothetical protein [Limimaricola litoreus]